MSDSLEKQLIAAFAAAWNEAAQPTLKRATTLSLLALREVSGEQMTGALAVATTWSAAFAAACDQALPGVLICLFKSEDSAEIDRFSGAGASDGAPKPGARALVNDVLARTVKQFATTTATPVSFSPVAYLDLAADQARLAKITGDSAWVGTFSLSIGDDLDSQALLLYAPHGALESAAAPTAASNTATNTNAAAQSNVNNAANAANATMSSNTQPPAQAPARRGQVRREEPPPRNIERLLEVELEIVVRFGVTDVPLREVVRMGTGTMIELNRAVDEPVELLVNNRLLARGEVVVVDGYYGVRITEIGASAERALSLVAGGNR